MLDLATIREQTDRVRAAAANKGEPVDLDALLAADADRRKRLTEVEAMRAEQNRASK